MLVVVMYHAVLVLIVYTNNKRNNGWPLVQFSTCTPHLGLCEEKSKATYPLGLHNILFQHSHHSVRNRTSQITARSLSFNANLIVRYSTACKRKLYTVLIFHYIFTSLLSAQYLIQ